MKKLLCLMGGAMLIVNLFAQKIDIKPVGIGEQIPNLPLMNLINYKDSTASLSSFGHKLIILDFWGIHCGSCIHMFPLEDSIQAELKDILHFVLVSYNSKEQTEAFIHKWDSTHSTILSLPIVTADKFLSKLFPHIYIPHYVWIAPDGKILGQTSMSMINRQSILETINWIKSEEARLKAAHYPASAFEFGKPKVNINLLLQQINHQ